MSFDDALQRATEKPAPLESAAMTPLRRQTFSLRDISGILRILIALRLRRQRRAYFRHSATPAPYFGREPSARYAGILDAERDTLPAWACQIFDDGDLASPPSSMLQH